MEWFAELAPPSLAEQWDRVGLQVGDPDALVRRVLLALTVTPSVVTQAENLDVDLIVAHHPVLFRPLQEFRWDYPQVALLRRLAAHNISVYVAHTNYDAAERGTSQILAARLSLTAVEGPLVPAPAGGGTEEGFGVVGQLPASTAPETFLAHVASSLDAPWLRHCGPEPSSVSRVAVLGGSGGSFIKQAAARQVDAYVTGDIDFHDALLAEDYGIWVIDAGHFATERILLAFWKEFLDEQVRTAGASLEILIAGEKDPFSYYAG